VIATSDAYKTAIDADSRQVIPRVKIDYTGALIDQSIERSANAESAQSIIDQVADGIETPTRKWWSWANFEWGNTYFPNDAVEVGYHSRQIARADKTFLEGGPATLFGRKIYGAASFGTFVNYPTVVVGFSERAMMSVKAVFDDKHMEWAEEFTIYVYDSSGALQHTEAVTGNTGVKYEVPITAILDAGRQELIIKKWSRVDTNAKVLEFLTSVSETYDGDEVFDLMVLEESETDDASLPIGNISANACEVSIHNAADKFNYGNDESPLNNQIKENRRISIWLSVVGADDLIPLGVFYSRHWSVPEQDLAVTVSGEDRLSLMAETTYSSNEIITAASDQNFSDDALSGWVLDNIVMASGVFRLGTGFPLSDPGGSIFATGVYAELVYRRPARSGTAIRTFSVNYTAGLTVYVATSWDANEPDNTEVIVEISFDGTNYESTTDGGVIRGMFDTDISGTYDLYVKVTLVERGGDPSFDSIDITVSQVPSVYSMAVAVCKDYGLLTGEYLIDETLGAYTIDYAYLNPISHRAALEKIAQAALARCYVDRYDRIIMESAVDTPVGTEKTLTNDDYYEKNNPAKGGKVVNEVMVTSAPLALASVAEEVASSTETIPASSQASYTLSYVEKPVMDAALDTGSLAAGVSLVSATYYTWGADVTLSNANGTDTETDIVIDGKPLRPVTGNRYSASNAASIREFGKITYEFPDNHLIQRADVSQLIADTLVDYYKVDRRDIEIVYPGDPSLLLSDVVTCGGAFQEVRQRFEFDGALEALIEGRAVV